MFQNLIKKAEDPPHPEVSIDLSNIGWNQLLVEIKYWLISIIGWNQLSFEIKYWLKAEDPPHPEVSMTYWSYTLCEIKDTNVFTPRGYFKIYHGCKLVQDQKVLQKNSVQTEANPQPGTPSDLWQRQRWWWSTNVAFDWWLKSMFAWIKKTIGIISK